MDLPDQLQIAIFRSIWGILAIIVFLKLASLIRTMVNARGRSILLDLKLKNAEIEKKNHSLDPKSLADKANSQLSSGLRSSGSDLSRKE